MRLETIEKLCCPFDKADLALTTTATDVEKNIIEGYLLCTQCQRIYPIAKGIPIMSPDEYRNFTLEQPLLERVTGGKSVEYFRLVAGGSSPEV